MDAVKFLEEWGRLCGSCKDCDDCCADSVGCAYCDITKINPRIVEIVKQWSAAHPRKTRLQDFLEKYPGARFDGEGTPESCCEELGYCKSCKTSIAYTCAVCWNEPV